MSELLNLSELIDQPTDSLKIEERWWVFSELEEQLVALWNRKVNWWLIFRWFEQDTLWNEIVAYEHENSQLKIYIKWFRMKDAILRLNPKIYLDVWNFRIFCSVKPSKSSKIKWKVYECSVINIVERQRKSSVNSMDRFVRQSLRLTLLEDHTVENFLREYKNPWDLVNKIVEIKSQWLPIWHILDQVRSRLERNIVWKMWWEFDFLLSDINDDWIWILVIVNDHFLNNVKYFEKIVKEFFVTITVDGKKLTFLVNTVQISKTGWPQIIKIWATFNRRFPNEIGFLRWFYGRSKHKLLHSNNCDVNITCNASCLTCKKNIDVANPV